MNLKFYVTFQCVRYNEHHSTDQLYYQSDYSIFEFYYESEKQLPFSCCCHDFGNFRDLLIVNDSIFFNTLVRIFEIPHDIDSCVQQDFITLNEFYHLLYDKILDIKFSSETSFTERVDLMYDNISYGYLEFSIFPKR